jgi:asparagine N-glycosylation enzyme membrane subunit Stt3
MDEQNFKKIKNYSNVALFSSILLVVFGFGFGIVNLAFFFIALACAIFGLSKNKEKIKSVQIKCIIAIVLILLAVSLYFLRLPGIIDLMINQNSMGKVDQITKPLFK